MLFTDEELPYSAIYSYIRRTGWEYEGDVGEFKHFTRGGDEMFFPAHNVPLIMLQVVRELARVEGRSLFAVMRDISALSEEGV